MKNAIVFWKDWSVSEKILTTLSVGVFFSSLVYLLWTLWLGEAAVFEWTSQGELTTVPLQIDRFEHTFFSFLAEVDGYLINENFSTSFLKLNYSAATIFALTVAFAWICILTAATYLRVHWYAVVMLGFALFLSFCNIDGLTGVQGLMDWRSEKHWFIVVLVVYGVVTYLIQLIDKGSVLIRFFLILLTTFGIGFYLHSEVNTLHNPVFFLANHGIVVPIALTFLFVIFNGHEIPRALYWLVLRGADGSNSTLRHFVIVSALFFAHMVYAYLISVRAVSWEIIYVPPFIIFVLMAIFGLWGFVGREEHYKKFFKARPVGFLLYIGWALLSAATIAFAVATQNDPLINILEDVIIYSNIGFALAFFIYVFNNFSELLEQSIQAYQELWRPRKMSWSFAALAAGFVITLFFYRHTFVHYNQAQAAYLNGVADTFLAEADAIKAEAYEDENQTISSLPKEELEKVNKKVEETYVLAKIKYRSAVYKIYTNHKGYWGLAGIALRQYHIKEATSFLKIASENTASPYTYTAVAGLMVQQNDVDEAYRILLEGVGTFPENPALRNNLIFAAMTKFDMQSNDSIFKELLGTKKYAYNTTIKNTLETNLWTLQTLTDNYSPLDSLEMKIKTGNNTGALSNRMLYQKRFFDPDNPLPISMQEMVETKEIQFDKSLVKDSVWDTKEMLYAYHYALLNPKNKGDSSLIKLLKDREQVLPNQQHIPFMLMARAIEEYHLGEVHNAFKTLQFLDNSYGNSTGQYKHLLGLWLLEHGRYKEATSYFNRAYQMSRGLNNLYEAIALSEKVRLENEKSEALAFWMAWDSTENHPFQATASEMLCLLQKNCAEKLDFNSLDEDAKRRYLHYQIQNMTGVEGKAEFAQKLRTMTNQNLKLEVVLDKIEFDLQRDSLESALVWREAATQLSADELSLKTLTRFQFIDLELLWRTNKLLSAASVLDDLKPIRSYQKSKKKFYEALYAEQLGDSARAEKAMQMAVVGLPFDFEVLEEAVAYYHRKGSLEKAYKVALQMLETFPSSPKANAVYAIESLKMGLDDYAEGSKDFLKLNAPQAYQKFLPKYDTLKKQREEQVQQWLEGEN